MFDIYGTLFISGAGDISISQKKPVKMPGLERMLNQFGIDKKPEALRKDLFREIEKRHAESRSKGVDYPEVEVDRIWMNVLGKSNHGEVRQFAELFELIVNPVYPMPNLGELLAACKDSGILMGIISNAQFYTPYLFNRFFDSDPEGLGFHPDLTIYSYRFGCAKPSLCLFQTAAARLKNMGVAKESVLYVGNDMLNDIMPAKKTGFKTALFAGDKRSLRLRKDEPLCKNIKADLVITGLAQLIGYRW
ncbi:MAG: HAD family hydrolase [Desulfosarcina sp.]|nr:HAD family hydrolase [Desulfobacterales bacterium]